MNAHQRRISARSLRSVCQAAMSEVLARFPVGSTIVHTATGKSAEVLPGGAWDYPGKSRPASAGVSLYVKRRDNRRVLWLATECTLAQ